MVTLTAAGSMPVMLNPPVASMRTGRLYRPRLSPFRSTKAGTRSAGEPRSTTSAVPVALDGDGRRRDAAALSAPPEVTQDDGHASNRVLHRAPA